ncbi:flagellar biosynthesis protein [Halomonas ventosae]|uniref:Flagellar biosynthetic protein FlhB n=1 Tax=Halomonas ventosae TaxID=229007 RepID=A0A4R6ZV83_9GAMM|nr:EscU/YscU/HrcU family type III secretion system export apparatus switch protein [Halomonas ventosae]TDR56139.1 flagellar biosynthesis protein [Halomonas ventosae]
MPEQTPDRDSRRHAVALSYREGNTAPRVVAKGYGELAERIIEAAKQHDIFIHDSPELVSLLMQVRLDEQIPETLYQVVAELLAWVIDIDQRK